MEKQASPGGGVQQCITRYQRLYSSSKMISAESERRLRSAPQSTSTINPRNGIVLVLQTEVDVQCDKLPSTDASTVNLLADRRRSSFSHQPSTFIGLSLQHAVTAIYVQW